MMTIPLRNRPLSFCEELVILLLNEERGFLRPLPQTNSRAKKVRYAMAGSVLMELAFANRIDTDLESLFVVDSAPTGYSLLDPVLKRIAAQDGTRDTFAWLRVLAAEDAVRICDQVLVLLVRRGMLGRRDGSFHGAFAGQPDVQAGWWRRMAWRPGARLRRRAGRTIGKRVREALLSDDTPDPRDAALIGLGDAFDLLGAVLRGGEIDRLRPRVVQLRRLDQSGREITRAVSDIMRGGAQALAADQPDPVPTGDVRATAQARQFR